MLPRHSPPPTRPRLWRAPRLGLQLAFTIEKGFLHTADGPPRPGAGRRGGDGEAEEEGGVGYAAPLSRYRITLSAEQGDSRTTGGLLFPVGEVLGVSGEEGVDVVLHDVHPSAGPLGLTRLEPAEAEVVVEAEDDALEQFL